MRRVLALCLLTAACASPSPEFSGAPEHRVIVDGSLFSVRVRGERAESLRISPERAPHRGTILARSARAISAVSGCGILSMRGDAAIQAARLDCPGRPGVPRPFYDVILVAIRY